MKTLVIMVILILCCVQIGISQTISLDEFLDIAQQNHPFFEKESLSVNINIETQKRYLGDKDWVVESSPFISYDDKSDIISSTYDKLSQVQLNGSLQKKFWSTGGKFSVSYFSSYIDQDNRTAFSGVPFKLFKQQLSLTYSHPLLKNRGGILDRLDYDLAAYAIDFSELQSKENQETFLLNMGISFLDWVFFDRQLLINRERLELAEKELKTSREKYNARLIDKVDVLRQEDAQRIAEQNVVFAQSQWLAKQTELAVLVPASKIHESKPQFDIYRLVELDNIEETISRLNDESRIMKAFEVIENQLNLKIEGFINQGKAQLDFNLSSALIEDDESYGKSYGIDNPNLYAGFKFTYPLGSRTSKSNVKRAKIEMMQLKADRQNTFIELESSIRGLLIQIGELEKVLELNQNQIESARERTAEELKVYKQGRGDMTFVIQSQDNEANARLTYLKNAVSYHKLVLQYKSLLDQLLKSE
ncbi:MAG: TolC family protein [candidate division Zixibacteria bacterium]|nr:TolC family protein [candidate division Zixibacteria bacterium]